MIVIDTLNRAIQEGDLQSVKVGGRRLITKEALTLWAHGKATETNFEE